MLRSAVRSLLTLLLLVLLAAALTVLFISWRVNSTGSRDQAQLADAIVILGARVDPDGQPGPDLRARTLHGVELFGRGLAPYVICTGGYRNDRLSAAAVACTLARQHGVPAEKTLLAEGSMTTSQDAASTRTLMAARGWSTAILVSHPLHLERARSLFANEGITPYPSPTSTDLGSIPPMTRAWLTARETVGILWTALEPLGLPNEWVGRLSELVYDSPPAPASE